MTEADVSKKLREALASLGAVAWKMSDRFHASRPDLLVFKDERGAIAIETKIFPNLPTALQKWTLVELMNAGVYTVVATYDKKSKELRITDIKHGTSVWFRDIKESAQWLLRQRS